MTTTSKPPLPGRTHAVARRLRQSQTDAEATLWYHLRAGRLQGHKFRRQHPMPPYVVDFVCEEARLVVELDGSQHAPDADATRTRYLEAAGYRVMRFWDNEALTQTNAVLEAILSAVGDRTLTPGPSPEGRGEQSPDSRGAHGTGTACKAERAQARSPRRSIEAGRLGSTDQHGNDA